MFPTIGLLTLNNNQSKPILYPPKMLPVRVSDDCYQPGSMFKKLAFPIENYQVFG